MIFSRRFFIFGSVGGVCGRRECVGRDVDGRVCVVARVFGKFFLLVFVFSGLLGDSDVGGVGWGLGREYG